MSDSNIQVDVDESVATLTFRRPQVLNALNRATLEELESTLSQLRGDASVGGLILTGEGDRSFVAGADIAELSRLDPIQAREFAGFGQSIFTSIERFPKPVVAAINGFCLGGGCELAMACHIRFASTTARFGQPEVKLGIIPGYGGTKRLPRLVGMGRALELILSGEMIDAQEAWRIGLVNRVVQPEQLMDSARKFCRQVLSNGPLAVRYATDVILEGYDMPLREAMLFEATSFGLCTASEDMTEGTQAFLAKRKPDFKGK